MHECTIKNLYNKPPIVLVFMLSLTKSINFLYNYPIIGQLITSHFKFSIVALQTGKAKLISDSPTTDTTLITTTSND